MDQASDKDGKTKVPTTFRDREKRNEVHPLSLALTATIDKKLASFPGSPLAPTKYKNRRGEPGIDSHAILQHNDITAIITKRLLLGAG